MTQLNKEHLPVVDEGEMSQQVELNKELLPEWEDITKFLYVKKWWARNHWNYEYDDDKGTKKTLKKAGLPTASGDKNSPGKTAKKGQSSSSQKKDSSQAADGSGGKQPPKEPPKEPLGGEGASSGEPPKKRKGSKKSTSSGPSLGAKVSAEVVRAKTSNPLRKISPKSIAEASKSPDLLGEGAAGVVYSDKSSQPHAAVKLFKHTQTPLQKKQVAMEVECSIAMGSPSVGIGPEVVDCGLKKTGDSFVATELCRSTLTNVQSSRERKKRLLEVFSQAEKLHKEHVAHRDLKDDNIFIHDEKGALLGDYSNHARGALAAYMEMIQTHGYLESAAKELGFHEHYEKTREEVKKKLAEDFSQMTVSDKYNAGIEYFYEKLNEGMPSKKATKSPDEDAKKNV